MPKLSFSGADHSVLIVLLSCFFFSERVIAVLFFSPAAASAMTERDVPRTASGAAEASRAGERTGLHPTVVDSHNARVIWPEDSLFPDRGRDGRSTAEQDRQRDAGAPAVGLLQGCFGDISAVHVHSVRGSGPSTSSAPGVSTNPSQMSFFSLFSL
jgi:hypothetical protein